VKIITIMAHLLTEKGTDKEFGLDHVVTFMREVGLMGKDQVLAIIMKPKVIAIMSDNGKMIKNKVLGISK